MISAAVVTDLSMQKTETVHDFSATADVVPSLAAVPRMPLPPRLRLSTNVLFIYLFSNVAARTFLMMIPW